MSGGTISGNSSSSSGGGVYVGGDTFTMSGGTISGNSSSSGGGVSVSYGTFTMSGGTISGNSSPYFYGGGGGGGVFVDGSGTFAMGNNARIDPSNEVYLNSGGISSITLAGDFSDSDTIAVIDLRGGVNEWLEKPVLARDAGYTGTIPVDRFILGNFVSYDYYPEVTKTPITNYVINSEGKLVNK
jgi:hypothetical protein